MSAFEVFRPRLITGCRLQSRLTSGCQAPEPSDFRMSGSTQSDIRMSGSARSDIRMSGSARSDIRKSENCQPAGTSTVHAYSQVRASKQSQVVFGAASTPSDFRKSEGIPSDFRISEGIRPDIRISEEIRGLTSGNQRGFSLTSGNQRGGRSDIQISAEGWRLEASGTAEKDQRRPRSSRQTRKGFGGTKPRRTPLLPHGAATHGAATHDATTPPQARRCGRGRPRSGSRGCSRRR